MRTLIAKRLNWLVGIPRWVKKTLFLAIDIPLISVNLAAVMALRLGVWDPLPMLAADPWFPLTAFAATLPIFIHGGLYRAVLRYGGLAMLTQVVGAVSLAVAAVAVAAVALASPDFPLSVLPLLWGSLVISIGASRLLLADLLSSGLTLDHARIPIAIYGAGRAGVQLNAALRSSTEYEVVAFFDDNPSLQGRQLASCRIHAPDKLEKVIAGLRIQRIVLATPTATPEQRHRIIRRLGELPVKTQTLPPLNELVDRGVRPSLIRDVQPEELLWREPVAPMAELLHHDVTGKSVMVSGGGGSIGAELCRQIVALQPRRLVVLDSSEFALYTIENELRDLAAGLAEPPDLAFVLGSVCDSRAVADALLDHNIQTLYHAAAYKHVPIVEHNPLQGVVNNALGTWRTAQAALDCGVEKFILISTDKAVRPTNVMGASKRLAEMVLQALAQRPGPTVFTMVRFGNVLNSAGSVVPLFRAQLAKGGPLTVTHRDILRYFMTIPEAANLVLQAGALAHGGEVFLLDMGEPVRIFDLATRIVHMSGLTVRDEANPDGDIPIVVTGLRPGEKLFEELFIGSEVEATPHPRVLRGKEKFLPWAELHPILRRIELATEQGRDAEVLRLLRAAVPEYRPQRPAAEPTTGELPRMRLAAAPGE